MSETLSINPTMPIEAEQANGLFNQIRNNAALRFSGLALSTAVVLTGCNGSTEKENASSEASTGTATVEIENTCGEIDFGKNFADKNFGAATAVFPNLYKTENGKQILLEDENVSDILKTTVSQDYRALAYVKAIFFDTRSAVNVADLSAANIAKNAQNLIKSYEDRSRNILEDAAEVCNGLAPAFIESTDSFRASQNLVTEAAFIRENGELAKTGFMPAAATGVLSGFKLNPNFDDPALGDRLPALKELADSAIVTKDGKIVLKLVTGPLMFDLDKTAKTTPVDIKVAEGEQIVISPKQDKNEAPTGAKQNNNDQEGESPRGTNGGTTTKTGTNTGTNGGTTETGTNGGDAPTGSNGGTETGDNGCGTTGQPECGGGSGSDTGNEGTGDGDGGTGGGDGGSGGETGGGEEPAPAPKPQPTQEPAPKPQPTQEPAPKPQPTQEPQPEPTKEPEPTQPPKGEEPAPECDPEYTPEGCN